METQLPLSAPPVVVTVKEFLITEQCPPDWRSLDLYLFRDEDSVFYVGQSYLAFERVWQHLRGGFKSQSVIGRFILCNWPASMRFTIELLSSRSERFAAAGHDLDAAERCLIEQLTPCFNTTWNARPTALPEHYAPPTAKPRCSRSLSKLMHEARQAVRADQQRRWRSGDN